MKSVNEFCNGIKQAGTPDETTNFRGNQVYRLFMNSERYEIDFASDFKNEGWLQFDTNQDAPYFGFWVNPKTLQTLNYCEGDWTVCDCKDAESYNAEMVDAIECYADGFIAKTLDHDGTLATYVQDRSQFLIEGAL